MSPGGRGELSASFNTTPLYSSTICSQTIAKMFYLRMRVAVPFEDDFFRQSRRSPLNRGQCRRASCCSCKFDTVKEEVTKAYRWRVRITAATRIVRLRIFFSSSPDSLPSARSLTASARDQGVFCLHINLLLFPSSAALIALPIVGLHPLWFEPVVSVARESMNGIATVWGLWAHDGARTKEQKG